MGEKISEKCFDVYSRMDVYRDYGELTYVYIDENGYIESDENDSLEEIKEVMILNDNLESYEKEYAYTKPYFFTKIAIKL